MVSRLLKWLRPLAVAMSALAALIVVLMMLNVTADVVGRTFFHKPVHATLEIVENIYMVCLCFLAMPLVQCDRDHLVIELFVRDADSPVGRVATLLSTTVALAICGLISWKVIGIAIEKTEIDEVVYLVDSMLPVWWVRWVIALVFSLLTVILALQLVEDLQRFGKPHAPKGGKPQDGAAPAELIG